MSFNIDLNNFASKLESESAETTRRIGEDLFVSIKDLTPVKTGRARDGWKNVSNREYTTIFNEVEYVVYLEEGTSTQAPNGFVKVSIKRIINNINNGKYKIR